MICTMGYLIHRLVGGELEFLGIAESPAKAQADIQALAKVGQEWSVSPVPFVGWGFDAVFTNNGGEVVRAGTLQ